MTVETVTVGFIQTSYSTSEDGPLNVQVCAEINNLMGDLECNLTINLNAISSNKSSKLKREVVTLCLYLVKVCTCASLYVLTWYVLHTVLGEDFTIEAGDVFQATFIAMSTSDGDIACDEGTIIDDDVLEGEHSFEIEIASTDPQLTNINPASAMVTIQDNEGTAMLLNC